MLVLTTDLYAGQWFWLNYGCNRPIWHKQTCYWWAWEFWIIRISGLILARKWDAWIFHNSSNSVNCLWRHRTRIKELTFQYWYFQNPRALLMQFQLIILIFDKLDHIWLNQCCSITARQFTEIHEDSRSVCINKDPKSHEILLVVCFQNWLYSARFFMNIALVTYHN